MRFQELGLHIACVFVALVETRDEARENPVKTRERCRGVSACSCCVIDCASRLSVVAAGTSS